MRKQVALAFAVACGNDTAAPDASRAHDAHVDSAPDALALPDLTFVTAQMNGTTSVGSQTFGSSDCEVIEGCVGSAGTRQLLGFDTVVENIGAGDLVLGPVPGSGEGSGYYEWDTCSMRHLVPGFVSYTLSSGSAVVASGHKQAFCIEDVEQVEPVASHGYGCSMMGITVGWADVYAHGTSCQWVDVTDLGSGTYTLTVTVDPTGVLPDADPDNNAWTTVITL
jgi:hypothetical protein